MTNKVNLQQGQVLQLAPKFTFPPPAEIDKFREEKRQELLAESRAAIIDAIFNHLTGDDAAKIKFAGGSGFILPEIVEELRESGWDAGVSKVENKNTGNHEWIVSVNRGNNKLVKH